MWNYRNYRRLEETPVDSSRDIQLREIGTIKSVRSSASLKKMLAFYMVIAILAVGSRERLPPLQMRAPRSIFVLSYLLRLVFNRRLLLQNWSQMKYHSLDICSLVS
ncbi:hypothetical protein BDD12DRAFT_805516 [Trichophaea hybrida]|nr:hypothetical protein BDD12DRAFT_805516 [Trichophaea hybrida]